MYILKGITTVLFLLLLAGQGSVLAQNSNPTISACDGKQYLCVTADTMEACVKIVIDTTYSNLAFVDYFEIDWGDNSNPTIIPGSINPPPQTHFYDLTEFADSCTYQGFHIIILRTHYTLPSIEPTNSAFILTLRNPPKANFHVDSYIACLGEPVKFIGTGEDVPCSDKSLNYQSWLVQDSTFLLGNQVNYQWDSAGVQTLRYCAGNVCDTVCRTTLIAALNATQANAVIDSGATQLGNLHYRVCFEEPWSIIRLDGSVSLFEDFYSWLGDGQQNWFWYPNPNPADTSVARILFIEPGTYEIKLKADNLCRQPDTVTLKVEVVEPPTLSLSPQRDTCLDLSYTPSPFIPEAIYRINGIQADSFPVMLPVSTTPYYVEAELIHTCKYQLLKDTFLVETAREVEILSPDTSRLAICVNSDTMRLKANLPVIWTGAGLKITPQDTFFVQNIPGVYRFIAFRDYGICRRADTLLLKIDKPITLTIDTPSIECLLWNYTPATFEPEAVYTINNVVIDSFPFPLTAANSPFNVVATVQNTCTDTTVSTTLLVIYPKEVDILSPDTALCTQSPSFPLWASDSTGYWTGEHLFNFQGQTWFNPVNPGVFALVYTRGVGICLDRDTISIQVAPSDSIEAGADIYVCETESSVEITGFSPGGFFTGTGVSGNTIDLQLLKRDSAYIYLYTNPSFPPGCRSDELTVVVRSLPVSGFQLDRDTACQGESINLLPNAVGGVVYDIDWGNGIANTLSASYSLPGTYLLQYVAYNVHPVTGLPLCTIRDSATIEIPAPLPPGAVEFIAQPNAGCAPLTVQFINLSDAQHNHYLWESGPGQSFYGYSPPPITYPDGLSDTIFPIRLSVPGGCGFYEAQQFIKVLPNPVADFAISSSEICSGSMLEASLLSTQYPLSNTYYTSTGEIRTATAGISSIFQFYAQDNPDTIGIWLVSSNACSSDTAYQEVVVHPAAVNALIGIPATPRCVGSPVILYSESTEGAPVFWQFSDGNTFLSDTVSIIFNTPGTYTATLYTFGCGHDSMTLTIQVFPTPELGLVADPNVCASEEVQFQVNTNATDMVLSYGDGVSTTQTTSTHSYAFPGIYSILATATSPAGCKTTLIRPINVLELPEIQATAENQGCTGKEVFYFGASPTVPVSCYWRFGDGNVASECHTAHIYSQPGDYQAIFTAFAGNGCTQSDTTLITVLETPTAAIEYALPQTCVPATASFQVNSQTANNFIWKYNGLPVSFQKAFEQPFLTPGAHEIALTVSYNGLCTDSSLLVLQFDNAIQAEIIVDPLCDPEDGIDLRVHTDPTNIVTVSAPGYTQIGDFHPSLDTGMYHIKVRNQIGCVLDTTVLLSLTDLFELAAGPDYVELRPGGSVQFSAISNEPDAVYSWEPELFLSNSDISNPVCTPERSMVYYVYATNPTGCVRVDTVRVMLKINREEEVYIPDAFTPNDDGVNDLFYVRTISPSVHSLDYFRIYDKYNALVFDAQRLDKNTLITPENPEFGWNGAFFGQKAEAGSYRYVIAVRFIDQKVSIFSGTLQLIR
ncbi:MAG: PKD domain-containing protein [Saprospiraceae bacterium]|nr:PKD domain-containing protein [Saprospiraceae bacterium]